MTRPALAVVVPSVNGYDDLAHTLQALDGERREVELEVLVPDRLGGVHRDRVTREFPWVRLLPAPETATIPELRALAFRAVTASAVAVIEDHVVVPRGWARALLAALAEAPGAAAVGGAVTNAATETVTDWAAFLCEYSPLLPPLPSGVVHALTGNNTVYRGPALQAAQAAWEAGRWEDHLHRALEAEGGELVQRPEIVVGHRKHYTVAEYASQRFLYARAWAGMRAREWSPLRRLVVGGLTLALPALLYLRIVRTVWGKGGHRAELLRSLPLLALFVIMWGAGEIVGTWAGAGQSLRRVK